ncbi:UxaA family hydrolase [Marinimicrococcus flavescens]|uniref:Altronate dehydratase family protein n=1 Tax=Marinimicrococcus flavescens TaxID=3031815 RepID=A0AAP3XPG5_9PROT|nr:altronate dehydratase family protein [Marinimicrococcus flavescens]
MTASASPFIRLNPNDNTIVARLGIEEGTLLAGEDLLTRQKVPAGHKIATRPIAKGEPVRKFNQIIGFASADIEAGEHIHVHNCAMGEFDRDYAFGADVQPTVFVPEAERPSFQGFVRPSGRIGTRNFIGVISTVNCSATVCKFIAEQFPKEVLAQYPNVDGVVAITHATGCGMADRGDGFAALQRTLWGFARHPNFAGILMIGLGCEVNQIDFLLEAYQIQRGPLFRTMTMQETGGTRKTVDRAVAMIKEMLPHAAEASRQPVSVGEISLALQCGGSDGYSGITANPALGYCADLLVRHGGTAILAETPEIYGAEHLLTRRAVSPEVGQKLVERIRWWEEYCRINGGEMNNNPSPGNKAGGLTTILEKSLGAAAKGGTTNLTGVYKYAEPVTARGFVFMDSPGYDPCSVTGQVASGANMVTFTTGRGSCFGYKPVPSIKIATNSAMYRRIEEDMDVNCGTIADGEESIEQAGRRIFDLVVRVASGEQSKSEALGVGDHEFVPWQIGATM